MPLDAVIVLGSGVISATELDAIGLARLKRGIEAVGLGRTDHLIITGNYRMPGQDICFAHIAGNIALVSGISTGRMWIHGEIDSFSTDTRGDLLQAIEIARANGWRSLGVITEKPHFRRIKVLLGPYKALSFEWFDSLAHVSWRYWAKETIATLLVRSKIGYWIYQRLDTVWHRIQPIIARHR